MWLALMHSENYEWIGFGNTESDAIKSIADEWNSSDRREHMSAKRLKEWYGIYTTECKKGCEVW